jgi:hypothetical protein
LVSLFGPYAADLKVVRKNFNFRYLSAAHFVQIFRDLYGPTHKAFAALDAKGQASLEREMTALLNELDVGGGRGLVAPSEYVEVVVTVR